MLRSIGKQSGESVIRGVSPEEDKKLSYRRGTARCVVSIEILPIENLYYTRTHIR